jgi:hypothetical protein
VIPGDRKLLPFVDDSNAYLRAALAHALSSLDGSTPEVRQALVKLSDDDVRHVALAAERALANCDSAGRTCRGGRTPVPSRIDSTSPGCGGFSAGLGDRSLRLGRDAH